MNNPKSLRILVLLSLLMLFGFLVYWNIENYNRAKTELVEDLTIQMSLANSIEKDVMLDRLIKVIRVDSLRPTRFPSLTNNKDSVYSETVTSIIVNVDEEESSDNWLPKRNSDTIMVWHSEKVASDTTSYRFPGKLGNDLKGPFSFEATSSNFDSSISYSRKLLTHTIRGSKDEVKWKLEIGKDEDRDSISVYADLSHGFGKGDALDLFVFPSKGKTDSLFTVQLKSSGINISHKLVREDKALEEYTSAIVIPFENKYFGLGNKHAYSAVFTSYAPYLWRQILPSLLVSFLLFGVVAISFFTIMRSWLAQLRLTTVRNEFVSNMTHELNTPIATMSVAMEALENFGALGDKKKQAEYIAISKHEIGRLKLLVDRVMNMSIVDDKEVSLVKSNVYFNDLVKDTMTSMKFYFDKQNADVSLNIEGDDFVLHGDKLHLTNVIYNLLDNALKYSNGSPKVNIDLREHSDTIELKVSDNGIGISKEYILSIFDRFFRVPTLDTHNVKGHGLGLNYTKTIIEQHQGTVSLQSELGKGSTFIINLPKHHD